jgi:hypothetical protein
MRKEKKKKPYLWPGGLEARAKPSRPAHSLPPFRLGRRAEPSSRSPPLFPAAAWAGLGNRSRAPFFLLLR